VTPRADLLTVGGAGGASVGASSAARASRSRFASSCRRSRRADRAARAVPDNMGRVSGPDPRERPIGVFDSGVGGLTVLHELLVALPHEDFVYLGDTARFPYGTRTREELERFSLEIADELLARRVKLLVVACNSATAAALPALQRRMMETTLGVDVLGVVRPGAIQAVAATRNGRIGLLATPSTIASRAYEEAIAAADPHVDVVGVEAPGLAELIEGGFPFDERVVATVRGYCAPLREAGVDNRDPRLHPLPARAADAPALARARGDDRDLRRGRRPPGRARARVARARQSPGTRGGLPAFCARATPQPSARRARGSCRCRSARSSTCACRGGWRLERALLRPRSRRPAADADRPRLRPARGRLGADHPGRDARDLHRLGAGERPALDERPGPRLGHGGVRDAPGVDGQTASSATRRGDDWTAARSRSSG